MATRDMIVELLTKAQVDAAQFRAEMREFQAEMRGFQAEMREFQAEMREFQAETRTRLDLHERVMAEQFTQLHHDLQHVIRLLDDHGERGRRIRDRVDDHEHRIGVLERTGPDRRRRAVPSRRRKRRS